MRLPKWVTGGANKRISPQNMCVVPDSWNLPVGDTTAKYVLPAGWCHTLIKGRITCDVTRSPSASTGLLCLRRFRIEQWMLRTGPTPHSSAGKRVLIELMLGWWR